MPDDILFWLGWVYNRYIYNVERRAMRRVRRARRSCGARVLISIVIAIVIIVIIWFVLTRFLC